jgi:zinc finger-containing ubiquitin peptidase 1
MLTVGIQAQALFQSLNVPCTAKVFAGKKAWQELLDAIEEYFTPSVRSTSIARVHQTKLPPVFLQRPRHSITVVGIERLQNGKRRLLTFDPGYRPPAALRKASQSRYSQVSAWLILWRYQRDEAYLKRYQSFEILFLDTVP